LGGWALPMQHENILHRKMRFVLRGGALTQLPRTAQRRAMVTPRKRIENIEAYIRKTIQARSLLTNESSLSRGKEIVQN